MACAVTCHYARAALFRLHKEKGSKTLNEQHREFTDMFGCDMTKAQLTRNRIKVAETLKRRWNHGGSLSEYLKVFSTENWKKWSTADKMRHSMGECSPCYHKKKWTKEVPSKRPRSELYEIAQKSRTCSTNKSQEAEPSKVTPEAKKDLEKEIAEDIVTQIENKWAEVELDNILADRTTYSSHERGRKRSFETRAEAEERHARTSKRPKVHIPSVITFNGEKVLSELKNWPEGTYVNWTELATKEGVKGNNKGQIIKDYARKNQIDVNKLSKPRQPNIRRRRLAFANGVKLPKALTTAQLKEKVASKYSTGQYLVSSECTGSTVVKYTIGDNGDVVQRKLTTKGRQLDLTEVRRKLLQEHENANLMREHPRKKEEYKDLTREQVKKELEIIGEREKRKAKPLRTCKKGFTSTTTRD